MVKSAAVRPAATDTTGGAGNVPVCVAEDMVATFLSIMAIIIPIFIAFVFILFTALIVWLFWRRNKQKQIEQTV